MIVYELRNQKGELIAREFSESKIATTRMALENRHSGPLRLSKLFIQKDEKGLTPRVIDPLKKYKDRVGKW
jgi:hypothetical protein